ncbi:related to CTR3 - high-affinity copper transporter of the plasma membrane [Melanopsichium pennsylvanicum]|uniref:Copper transport protein n=2 Tax=Melanopsichium pennsylvanicum TaxID=63383 RepID=A0AAJ5C7Z3_9BASI|nr:ctr copper transporter family protein [Melanopsichium pennsylvanicum 4]SNX87450.1 related to CTR3 - high-affinity copper transporter of the plasma membrane [Melanopsichium pennsylvanicum]
MTSSMSAMSGMSGMSDSASESCSMLMLGNWQTIGTCVLTSSWHVKTEAQFAGTCIGVFLIVFLIETVRRWSREFDRYILERAMIQRRETRRRTQHLKTEMATRLAQADASQDRSTVSQKLEQLDTIFFGIPTGRSGCRQAALDSMRFRPAMWQQLLRSLLYGVQFTGAYLVMLIGMTFNGYILIAIILGGIFGHFFSTWDTLGSSHLIDTDAMGSSCSSEAGAAMASNKAAGPSCCQTSAGKDTTSISSGSGDDNHLKSHVVTLPDHGYGTGACCI